MRLLASTRGQMPDRIIGILGGMGPEATADLFKEIIRLTPAQRDQEHIPLLIYSNTRIPDRTAAILEGGEDPRPYLVQSARVLEKAGAGILAIPCNTAHYFLAEIQAAVSIPILNMVLETLSALRERIPAVKAAGLLATRGTAQSRIYHDSFEKHAVKVLVPDPKRQEGVSAAISQVKTGIIGPETRDLLMSAAASLVDAGAEAVILGCTEIPLVLDESAASFPCLNATRILAQAAVDWALGSKK
jgi:aspartate racemase